MSFLDAAEKVLESHARHQPMHYGAVTQHAITDGLLVTSGHTPEATMCARILTDADRRRRRGEPPRFVMRGQGLAGLAKWESPGIGTLIDRHNRTARDQLRLHVGSMTPRDFQALYQRPLIAIGFSDVQRTEYTSDGISTCVAR